MARKKTTWNEKLTDDQGLPAMIEFDTEKAAGIEGLKARIEAEGHTVVSRGKKQLTKNFERSLVSL